MTTKRRRYKVCKYCLGTPAERGKETCYWHEGATGPPIKSAPGKVKIRRKKQRKS